MHISVDHRENASADQDFARFTSPAAGAGLGSVAILATIATAVLNNTGTLPGLIAMACVGLLVTATHIALQGQAAIVVLRDGRWMPAVLAAAICSATLVALYFLAFQHVTGWYLMSAGVLSVVVYAHDLERGHR
jgi:hypothetical protein